MSFEESYGYETMINGTTSDIILESAGDLGLDPLIQAIIWIGVLSGIAVVSSFGVLGSGFSDSGTRWLVGGIFFMAIWVMFSVFPLPLIMEIGGIGAFIYLFLTIVYAVDVIIFLMGGGD